MVFALHNCASAATKSSWYSISTSIVVNMSPRGTVNLNWTCTVTFIYPQIGKCRAEIAVLFSVRCFSLMSPCVCLVPRRLRTVKVTAIRATAPPRPLRPPPVSLTRRRKAERRKWGRTGGEMEHVFLKVTGLAHRSGLLLPPNAFSSE